MAEIEVSGETLESTYTTEDVLPPEVRVPSPLAIGGAGERFEQRLDAYALALLLARATAPSLLDSAVVEVKVQTRHLGWQTDDILMIGETSPGAASLTSR